MKTELFHNQPEDVTRFLTRLEETLAARTDLTEEKGGMVWANISEARQILHMIQHRERLKNNIDRLESRLQKISDAMGNIVVTEGEDAGVVLLSTDAPCRYEAGSNVAIYDLLYFSPLGEALMEVYHLASQREAASKADETPDGQAENV